MSTETPLIFTARGNLPADSLKYEHRWTDAEDEVKFEEFWFLEGELVRNNCHIYKRQAPQQVGDVTVGLQGEGVSGQQAVMQ